ncbi:hypothetical protein N7478_012922 [Penicillium angulare]|uniref:uncharacterized protein n=1 Tax=Penicillium angulare TaxID=116970 RepID=UPI0025403E08|nr:uncharacterized protein N7478_012922 [Penicillium angulare]KAJ5256818.1 hypothetical protein N7478_012922 [Penicillium angulare]
MSYYTTERGKGLRFRAMADIVTEGDGSSRFMGALLPESEQVNHSVFPIYRPDEIEISLSDGSSALPASPRKVYIQGQKVAFFKPVGAGDVNSTCRELKAYARLKSTTFSEAIYTCRLLGIVHLPSSGLIAGLLLSYIDCNNTTLLCIGEDLQYISMRQKWLTQITRSIEGLHMCGAVWGDAKPDKVLIDTQYDAYLIDLGGDYSKGWVDKNQ